MYTRDFDGFGGTHVGLGQAKNSAELDIIGDNCFQVLLPFILNGFPFLLGELVDHRGFSVVLPRANEMLGIVGARQVPVIPKLAECSRVRSLGDIWLWVNGEVGVSKFGRPFIVSLSQD